MSLFEVVAMIISFGGVTMIAVAQGQKEELEGEEMKTVFMFGEDTKTAGIVGLLAMFMVSVANGVLSVLTRMMQSIHVSVMMCYIALISLILTTLGLCIESLITGTPMRLFHYTGEQYLYGFAAGSCNVLALLFKIIAF